MLLSERMAWISDRLQSLVPVYNNEYDLQAEIHATLVAGGARVDREVVFANSRNRVDLLVQVNDYDPWEPAIAIEVKTHGSSNDAQRQLARYSKELVVGGLILATTRVTHRMPPTINDKPVLTIHLTGAAL